MSINNTTYRVLVEKLGAADPSQFVGNEGEVFYDPNNPILKLSDGTTAGGVSVGSGGGGNDSRISSTQISNWDTAYGWGDHSTAGYLTSFSESDPAFVASVAAGIGSTNIDNWNTAYGWGDHSTAGYLTSFSETDPVFSASDAAGITSTDISNWNGAYGWGDHSTAGYLTSFSETDPVFSASPAAGIGSTNIDNWNTAYGWGDHSTAGYLTSFSETDPAFVASVAAGIGSTNIDNWNTAYGWGDHSVVGYQTATSTSYAQTLIVDPNGSDVTGNGGPNAPFQTLQAAHDYAAANNLASEQVVVKLNTGSYAGNLLVTRPNTHFVGPTNGVSKSTRISGIVTVSTASTVGGAASDMISFENIIIASSSGTSAVTIGGTFGCTVMFKDAYVFTSSSTAKCVDVTNTAPGGVGIHMKNTQLQNQSSSGTTLDLSNTYYANLDLVTLFGGTGISMNITTTDAVVYNTRIEKTGIGTAIVANSSFNAGKPSLVLGNATIVNPSSADNPDGILVPAGSIANIAQVAFNIAGTGFAVKGSAGSVVVNGNNLFVPGTTNKISSAIGAGNIPLTTTFTAA